jgi:hypothetical protein
VRSPRLARRHGEEARRRPRRRRRRALGPAREALPRRSPERINQARADPRFTAPVAALFRAKTPEASTDEELQALLDQIALLATLEGK